MTATMKKVSSSVTHGLKKPDKKNSPRDNRNNNEAVCILFNN